MFSYIYRKTFRSHYISFSLLPMIEKVRDYNRELQSVDVRLVSAILRIACCVCECCMRMLYSNVVCVFHVNV